MFTCLITVVTTLASESSSYLLMLQYYLNGVDAVKLVVSFNLIDNHYGLQNDRKVEAVVSVWFSTIFIWLLCDILTVWLPVGLHSNYR